jgi:hypothetical protein
MSRGRWRRGRWSRDSASCATRARSARSCASRAWRCCCGLRCWPAGARCGVAGGRLLVGGRAPPPNPAEQVARWSWLRRPAGALWLAVAIQQVIPRCRSCHALHLGHAAVLKWAQSLAVVWAGLELLAALPLARAYSDVPGPLIAMRPWLPALLPSTASCCCGDCRRCGWRCRTCAARRSSCCCSPRGSPRCARSAAGWWRRACAGCWSRTAHWRRCWSPRARCART